MAKLCHEITNLGWPIQLWQQGRNKFRVVYGKQDKKDLSYTAAAAEFGECLMHALACESIINGEGAS